MNQDSLREKLREVVNDALALARGNMRPNEFNYKYPDGTIDALESICKEEVKSGQIEVWQKVIELYDDDTDEQFKWEHHDDFGSYAQAQISKLYRGP